MAFICPYLKLQEVVFVCCVGGCRVPQTEIQCDIFFVNAEVKCPSIVVKRMFLYNSEARSISLDLIHSASSGVEVSFSTSTYVNTSTPLKWLGWYSWVNPLLLLLPHLCQYGKGCGHICMVVEGRAWPGTHPLIGCCWTPLGMSIVGRVFRPNLTPPMELWSSFTSKGAQHYPYTVLLPTFGYPYEPNNDCNVCLILCNIMYVSYTASKDVRLMLPAGLLAS